MLLLDKALKYAKDCIEDKEVTTWEVKKQCQIFLEDYTINQDKEDFPYYFDETKLKVFENLLKLLNCATGFVSGKCVLDVLAGFQALLLVNLFGWRYKENPKKFRYRDVVLFIPRKSAKTFLCAIIIILLMLTEDDWSEFYSICLDRELAGKVKEAIEQILSVSPAIDKYFKMSRQLSGKCQCKLTHSFYQARTAEADKNNSIRPSTVIVDEVGAFVTNKNIGAMRSGQRSVTNPIMIKITTAYPNSDSVMLEELEYDRKILNGAVKNDRMFCLLYYANREEAWEDIGILRANPLRIEENYNEIKADREIAKIKTSEQEEYLTKSLNIFLETNEERKYLDIGYWKKCKVKKVDFEGKEVIVGVDMSVTTDLTAVGIMYREGNKIYCKSHGFLPEASLIKRREKNIIDYREMARLGNCDIHEGMTVNYSLVEEYIRSIESTYNCKIKYIVTDPMNAKEMIERLSNDYDVILRKQTYFELSPATKEFRKEVYDGNVYYEENSLLDWNMSNAVTTKGKADDEMLAKENKQKQRIDMVAVLIFCFTELIVKQESYNSLDSLKKMAQNW